MSDREGRREAGPINIAALQGRVARPRVLACGDALEFGLLLDGEGEVPCVAFGERARRLAPAAEEGRRCVVAGRLKAHGRGGRGTELLVDKVVFGQGGEDW